MKAKLLKAALAATLTLAAADAALAEAYVDYTPQKGGWTITAIEVDPNHVDEYLTGLRKSQIPTLEVLKQRGLIDAYRFVVRNGYVKGAPNVLIMTHYPTMAAFDADKARDQAIEKDIFARFSREQSDKAVAGYEKYRTFIDDGTWTEMVVEK